MALLSLTPRELKLLCERRSNPKIADGSPSARIAKFHVQNIIEKLGVADRKQAAERATKLNVLPDER